MNLIPGLIHKNGSVEIGSNVQLRTNVEGHSGDVIIGIRPEDISITSKGQSAKVVVIEPTGAETQIYFDLGGESVVANLRERISPNPGDKLDIIAPAEKIHVFDAANGLSFPMS